MVRGKLISTAVLLAGAAVLQSCASGGEPVELAGVACQSPPPVHCPDSGCPGEVTSAPGNATDTGTGRKYFLDYPCNLRPGEKVIFVLNLHGGGSIGNWQRHYFPIMDFKEKYRLVVATPSGSNNGWNATLDDPHLMNIVRQVESELATKDVDVRAFWLAGHSLGGQTSNRLINSNQFFRERLTGWVSLSGGRLGSTRAEVRAPIPAAPASSTPGAGAPGRAGGRAGALPPGGGRGGAAPGRAGAPPGGGAGGLVADAARLPDFTFSHIYSSGEHELTAAGLPPESKWAQRLGCGPQTRERDIVDVKAGYVFDGRTQANRNPVWGLDPRPGAAKVYAYPRCPDGLLVADVIRVDKGHTEGLEPRVTEEIIKMMVAASPRA